MTADSNQLNIQIAKCQIETAAFCVAVVSSDPALECLPALEKRLQETNNLPAFLANIRKEFLSLDRC